MRIQLAASTCVTALALFTVPALADESWTHFYTGVYSDYSSYDTHLHPDNGYVFNISGLSGGFMAGYDQQFERLVVGLEGDVGYSGAYGSDTGGNGWEVKLTGLELAGRVRAGFATNNVLFYGTGGIASVPMHMEYNSGTLLLDQRQTGWQVGAGIEYAVSNSINIRGEYLYTDYGLSNGLVVAPGIQMQTHSNTFRMGLTYKF